MQPKTKYQYSYFIYPYMIDKKRYKNYIMNILKNKKYKVKLFEREKNVNLYTFFNPMIRQQVFPSMEYNNSQLKEFEKFDATLKYNILKEGDCSIFEYDIGENAQGKVEDEDGIFFTIQKIEIICFNTGICFIAIKTNIENSNQFADVLNFNYKFRDINSVVSDLSGYENIKIQTNSLESIKKLSQIIEEITGGSDDVKSIDVDTNRFLTYSYTCVEPEFWNPERKFENIQNEFQKYVNVLPSTYNAIIEDDSNIVSKWEYVKVGITKTATVLMSSGTEANSFTRIPDLYENELLYTYILALYQRLELKKLIKEFKENNNIIELSEKLIDFMRNLWVKEVTRDELGSKLYRKWRDTLELGYLYQELKNMYEIKYKKANIDKNTTIKRIFIFALCGSIAISMINYLMLSGLG